MMLPQVNEEVIIGFEHGDTRRPIVLGSLFNGKDKPGTDLLPEPRRQPSRCCPTRRPTSTPRRTSRSRADQKMTVEVTQDEKFKVKGNMNHETTGNSKLKAQQYTVEAGTTLTVKGVSVTVEACAAADAQGRDGRHPGLRPGEYQGRDHQHRIGSERDGDHRLRLAFPSRWTAAAASRWRATSRTSSRRSS